MADERDRDEKSGRFSPEYSDEEFLDALRKHEPAGTGEIAEEVGCHHQSAYHRLQKLEEEGTVEGKQVGRSLIWTLK